MPLRKFDTFFKRHSEETGTSTIILAGVQLEFTKNAIVD